MLFTFVLLVVLLIWGVYTGDVTSREGVAFVVVFAVLELLSWLLKWSIVWSIVAATLGLIILIVKIYGGDIKIW